MMGILGSRNSKDLITNILTFLLYVLILTFLLRYLWNGALVKHISILRPVNTLLETFLLAIGLSLLKM